MRCCSARRGRRLLHDRLAGTILVRASGARQWRDAPLADWQWTALLCIPALVLCGLAVFVPRPGTDEWDGTIVFQSPLTPQVFDAVDRLTYRIRGKRSGGPTRQIVAVTAAVPSLPPSPRETAATIARVLAAGIRSLAAADAFEVRFVRRADLGYARWSDALTIAVTPAQWRAAALPPESVLRPSPARVAPPPHDLPQARVSTQSRMQVELAMALAQPMVAAVKAYRAAHGGAIDVSGLMTSPGLQFIIRRDVRIDTSLSGAVTMKFTAGPMANYGYSWVPLGSGQQEHWICVHANIPAELWPECH